MKAPQTAMLARAAILLAALAVACLLLAGCGTSAPQAKVATQAALSSARTPGLIR